MSWVETLSIRAQPLRPMALAGWLARRTQGRVRSGLLERLPRWTPHRLLTFWGMPEARAAAVFQEALQRRMWCTPSSRGFVQKTVRELPQALPVILARADEALARKFRVFERTLEFGTQAPIDWSLDAGSGLRYPKVASKKLSLFFPGMDPKYPWELGRLDSLVQLAQGYALSPIFEKRAAYAEEVKRQWREFALQNPVGRGIHWTCAMEVALRAVNLALAFSLCSDAPCWQDVPFVLEAAASLANHAEFVRAHLEDAGRVPNNHLVANHLGLSMVGLLFPSLPNAPRWRDLGLKGLSRDMATQVHEDGVSFEGSVPYHRLVLEMFTLAYVTARDAGVTLGIPFERRLEKMFEGVEAWTSEDGLAPQVGDNDSGRALPFFPREPLEQGYLLPLGAALFANPRCKRPGAVFNVEAAWLAGPDGQSVFSRLPALGDTRHFVSTSSGLGVLKGAGATLTVSSGPAGQRGIGGHSHHHKLSFELHVEGVPLVVDPGSPTYTRSPLQRNAFRSTAAHNVVEVDGCEQGALSEALLFALPDEVHASLTTGRNLADTESLFGQVGGLSTATEEIHWERSFLLNHALGLLWVKDVLWGRKEHRVVSRLHLPNEECRLRPSFPSELERAAQVQGPEAFHRWAVELGPRQAPLAVLLVGGLWHLRVRPSSYSKGYGQIAPASVVELSATAVFPFEQSMCFLFRRRGWGERLLQAQSPRQEAPP